MDGVILECLLVYAALGIDIRCILAQVTKQYKDVIDASWFQLVTSGVMHTLFKEVAPRCVKSFVMEQHGYWQANDWVIHFENDASPCFAKVVEYDGSCVDVGLHRFRLNVNIASLVGEDTMEGSIGISLYRKGETRRVVLLKKTAVDLTDYDEDLGNGSYLYELWSHLSDGVESNFRNNKPNGVCFEFYFDAKSSPSFRLNHSTDSCIWMDMYTDVLTTVIGGST